jgi:hypothetical protein
MKKLTKLLCFLSVSFLLINNLFIAEAWAGSDESEVLTTVLFSKGDDPEEVFVVRDFSGQAKIFAAEFYKLLTKLGLDIEYDTIIGYCLKNEEKNGLNDVLGGSQRVVLITEDELKHILTQRGGWDEFREKYPKAKTVNFVSRAGFNPMKTQALVYHGWKSYNGLEITMFFCLQKKRDEWVVKESIAIKDMFDSWTDSQSTPEAGN